jgi:hypothetical protein
MLFPPELLSKVGMRRHDRGARARRRNHTAARWMSVVLYSVLTIGLPIPAGSMPVTGEIFPCMHHRCGCLSAEQCWRDCCCLSLEERLVWAKENGVTPPEYVLAEERSRGLLGSRSKPKCSCCAAVRTRSCCESSPKGDCCRAEEQSQKKSHAKASSVDGGIVLLEALKCRGVSDNWMGVGISLPPAAPDRELSKPLVVPCVEIALPFHSWASSPPTPPPRSDLA